MMVDLKKNYKPTHKWILFDAQYVDKVKNVYTFVRKCPQEAEWLTGCTFHVSTIDNLALGRWERKFFVLTLTR